MSHHSIDWSIFHEIFIVPMKSWLSWIYDLYMQHGKIDGLNFQQY